VVGQRERPGVEPLLVAELAVLGLVQPREQRGVAAIGGRRGGVDQLEDGGLGREVGRAGAVARP
jgi:hypothetical protein